MLNLLFYLIPFTIMIIVLVFYRDFFIRDKKDPHSKKFSKKRIRSRIKQHIHYRKNFGYLSSYLNL